MKSLFFTINFLGMIVLIAAVMYVGHHFRQFRQQRLLEQGRASGLMQNIRKTILVNILSTDLSPECQYHKRHWIYGQLVILSVFLVFGILLLLYNLLDLNFYNS
jgi:hypothetical protein